MGLWVQVPALLVICIKQVSWALPHLFSFHMEINILILVSYDRQEHWSFLKGLTQSRYSVKASSLPFLSNAGSSRHHSLEGWGCEPWRCLVGAVVVPPLDSLHSIQSTPWSWSLSVCECLSFLICKLTWLGCWHWATCKLFRVHIERPVCSSEDLAQCGIGVKIVWDDWRLSKGPW